MKLNRKKKLLKKSSWRTFLESVDLKSIGTKIFRKDLVSKTRYDRYTTIDTYRCLLTKLGVLETESPGVYVKRKNVDTNWKLSYVKEITDQDSWKSWFIQID